MKKLCILLTLILITSCGTYKKKMLISSLAGAGAGFAAGYKIAPEPAGNKILNGVLWGAATSALVATVAHMLHEDDPYNDKMKPLELDNNGSIIPYKNGIKPKNTIKRNIPNESSSTEDSGLVLSDLQIVLKGEAVGETKLKILNLPKSQQSMFTQPRVIKRKVPRSKIKRNGKTIIIPEGFEYLEYVEGGQ